MGSLNCLKILAQPPSTPLHALWQDNKTWGLKEYFVDSLDPDLSRTDCPGQWTEGPIFWLVLGASASSRLQTPTDANTAIPSLCVRGIHSAGQVHGPPGVDSLNFPFPADSLGFLTSSTIPLSTRQHSPHFNAGGEPVHIDVPIESQLLGKLWGQQLLDVRGEVAQGIPQCQLEEESGEGHQRQGLRAEHPEAPMMSHPPNLDLPLIHSENYGPTPRLPGCHAGPIYNVTFLLTGDQAANPMQGPDSVLPLWSQWEMQNQGE